MYVRTDLLNKKMSVCTGIFQARTSGPTLELGLKDICVPAVCRQNINDFKCLQKTAKSSLNTLIRDAY